MNKFYKRLSDTHIEEIENITFLTKAYGDSDSFVDESIVSNVEWEENDGNESFMIDWNFEEQLFEIVEGHEEIKTSWIPHIAKIVKQDSIKILINEDGFLLWKKGVNNGN